MKILEKAFTNDEFSIQLEDWREDYSFKPVTIAAYPKGKWPFRFRAWCDYETMEEAEKAFHDLRNGGITVFDVAFVTSIPGGKRVPMVEKIKAERENQWR